MVLTERHKDICIGVAVALISFVMQRYVAYLFAFGFSDKYADMALVFIWLFALIFLGAVINWWREEKYSRKFAVFAITEVAVVALFLLLLAMFTAVIPALLMLFVVSVGGCIYAIMKFGFDKKYFAKMSFFASIALCVNVSVGLYRVENCDVSFREGDTYSGYGLLDRYTNGCSRVGCASKFGNIIVPAEHSGIWFCQSRDGSDVKFVTVDKEKDYLGQVGGLKFTVFNTSGRPIDKFSAEFEKETAVEETGLIKEIESVIEQNVGIITSRGGNLYDLVNGGIKLQWNGVMPRTYDLNKNSDKQNDEIQKSDLYKEHNESEYQSHEESSKPYTPQRHETSVPVQEWQKCNNCWGSGQCQYCYGKGYIDTFNGPVDCTCCIGGKCGICAGNGGHYETVYHTRVDYY